MSGGGGGGKSLQSHLGPQPRAVLCVARGRGVVVVDPQNMDGITGVPELHRH